MAGSTKPVTQLSFTALERYRLCPWVYYATDILKQGQPLRGGRVRLGALVHHVIQQYHQANGLFPMTEEALTALYHQAADTFFTTATFVSPGEKAGLYTAGEAMLRRFHQNEAEIGFPSPLLVEAEFKFPLRPGFIITGRIDYADCQNNAYRVLDYKTTLKPPPSPLSSEQSRQLMLYGLGFKTIIGTNPDIVGIHYLAHDLLVTTDYSDEAAQEVLAEFHVLANAIEQQTFVPTPEKDKCSICPFQPTCPAFSPTC